MENLEQQENARKYFSWGVFLLSGIFLDQIFKYLFFGLVVIDKQPKYFGIKLFTNYNFAFSLPLPSQIIYSLYFVVLFGILFYLYKKNILSTLEKTAWGLILAGAISNIGERIYFGYVRDFIYIFSGIFNLADFYILFGMIVLLFQTERQNK